MNSFLHEAFPNPNKISFPAMYNMPRLYRGKQLKNQSKIQKIGVSGHFFCGDIFKWALHYYSMGFWDFPDIS